MYAYTSPCPQVEYVGGRTPTPTRGAISGHGGSVAATRSRPHASAVPSTPPPAVAAALGALPRSPLMQSPLPALDYVPGHMSGTIQQHAAQIHKLIAGRCNTSSGTFVHRLLTHNRRPIRSKGNQLPLAVALIAGLDFLEAHIIRQDQVVEGLQKQMVTVSCAL